MNKLEYNKVVDVVDIKRYLTDKFDINVYFNDSYYTVVEGIPERINSQLRLLGNMDSYLIKEIKGRDEYTYKIGTKEGLIIFLEELINGLYKENVLDYKEILTQVNNNLLKEIKPNINNAEWLKNDQNYINGIKKSSKTTFERELRTTIDEFDRTVNPFLDTSIELDNIENYLDKVNISVNNFSTLNIKKRDNCCDMYITDLKTNNKVAYFRTVDGFSYNLNYSLGENEKLSVMHYYTSKKRNSEENGEIIIINYYTPDSSKQFYYNITKDIAGTVNGEKRRVYVAQKEYVYSELLNAISLAKTITLDNMQKDKEKRKILAKN